MLGTNRNPLCDRVWAGQEQPRNDCPWPTYSVQVIYCMNAFWLWFLRTKYFIKKKTCYWPLVTHHHPRAAPEREELRRWRGWMFQERNFWSRRQIILIPTSIALLRGGGGASWPFSSLKYLIFSTPTPQVDMADMLRSLATQKPTGAIDVCALFTND